MLEWALPNYIRLYKNFMGLIMTEIPMGSRDDVLLGGGTGGTTSSPVTFPVPSHELG